MLDNAADSVYSSINTSPYSRSTTRDRYEQLLANFYNEILDGIDRTQTFGLANPQETADFIKNAARDWLLSDTSEPAITDPGPDTFGKMMSFFLGEEVPPEYVPMIRKDFGYSPEAAPRKITSTTNRRPRIAIIGAGASGLCLAHQFDIAGLDWHLYEKNDDVGGTWHENRYPGCGVDTPNHFYCYSFSPNPDWTHFFSGSSELLNYLERFADDNNLRDRVTCGTRVQSATWDDLNNVWDIELVDESGSRHDTVDILVSATGHFRILKTRCNVACMS